MTSVVGAVLVHAAPGRADALTEAGVTVLAAVTGAPDALAAAAATRPQVVVVDLSGGPDALVVIAAVVEGQPGTPVLAVSGSAEPPDVLAAVRAGATGYVVDTGAAVVADAVLRLARGEPVFGPGLASDELEARGEPSDAGSRLTDREIDVLRLVVEGLTARQIATRLVLSPRTVENHVQNLLRKLRLTNRAALVRYAIENGLA